MSGTLNLIAAISIIILVIVSFVTSLLSPAARLIALIVCPIGAVAFLYVIPQGGADSFVNFALAAILLAGFAFAAAVQFFVAIKKLVSAHG